MDNAGSGVDRRSAHRAYLIRQEQFGYEYMLEGGQRARLLTYPV